jgi:Protein of unknown function (DUF4435)
MADLFYSDEALNVKSAFYRANSMVFVEGDDDVLFWHEVFSKIPEASVEVESAGGSDQIDQYITKILSGELQAIAARDSDFLPHMTDIENDPRILYSFGYAIENSLYTAESIAALTRQWCKNPRISTQDCADWLADVVATLKPLIHLDLANRISNAGAGTVTDNCTRLMKNQTSCFPCKSKVSTQVTNATTLVPAHVQALAVKKLGNCPEELMRWLRGHFLASAVLKYVLSQAKALGRKIDLSTDSLYAAAIGHFGRVLGVSHPHQDHYIQTASAAYQAIR